MSTWLCDLLIFNFIRDFKGVNENSNNFDSCDGSIPVHRCDRCEQYETLSHAALLNHLSQCQGTTETETNNR